MARLAGFEPEARWGGFSRAPFTATSGDLVAVYRKRAEGAVLSPGDVVGLIPAAGRATRLGLGASSKELVAVPDLDARERPPSERPDLPLPPQAVPRGGHRGRASAASCGEDGSRRALRRRFGRGPAGARHRRRADRGLRAHARPRLQGGAGGTHRRRLSRHRAHSPRRSAAPRSTSSSAVRPTSASAASTSPPTSDGTGICSAPTARARDRLRDEARGRVRARTRHGARRVAPERDGVPARVARGRERGGRRRRRSVSVSRRPRRR